MAGRFAIVSTLLLVFVLFQVFTDASVIQKRDVSTTSKPSDASQTIDDALKSFKSGLDDLLKNIQENELYQKAGASLKDFGDQIQSQGQELVDKIKSTSASKTR